ncbi:FecCD family ABC transporter permease [Chlorobium phaeovibrioides]|uniref:Iron ABC transporter permease n=1 Tax=Chlorobium phaeovibrioides TaxID=1094 RepID=A0A5M8ID93_CHLPH|nr:iron ABC transporter permease [Chlorobium phaeovibrioides]KAA6232422.1 iron ABC transporter permease [Chlorobium phaeovibrioides]MWV55011.1 iron chelate uptake ABC transporter family permease subunit [Chlorobium phaeovibrioides]
MKELKSRHTAAIYFGVIFALFLLFVASLLIGRYPVPLSSLHLLVQGGGNDDPAIATVLFSIRLPRIIGAVLVGGALSLSGSAYQGLFRNPMVSPDILGVSSGAGFGAALAILLSLPVFLIQVSAFIGGLCAVLLALTVARSAAKRHEGILVLVLSGIVISAVFTALISLMKYVADPESKLPTITYWLMGSLADIRMSDLPAVLAFLGVGMVPLLLLSWRLNVLSFGEEDARSLGINITAVRITVIIAASLITASVISISGLIGWIGLLVPHAARLLVGPDHRLQLPLSFLLGGMLLLFFDAIARTILTIEIPIGIVTALVGAPFFIVILKYSSRKLL